MAEVRNEPVPTQEVVPLEGADGHRWELLATIPDRPHAALLWLPAMGVAAKHYRPFAEALAARGVATFVHEWRGNGSSSLRASRERDWGYGELLGRDLPASEAAISARLPGLERILGGHSLGGQLACCHLAMAAPVDTPSDQAAAARRLWLVASGAPYWRAFPAPTRYGLPLAYRFLPWLADRNGVLPGRRLGFAGQEARGVIRDWSRTAISGRYAAAGLAIAPVGAMAADASDGRVVRDGGGRAMGRGGDCPGDLEHALRGLDARVDAVLLDDDWLAPPSSLRYLLSKLGDPVARVAVFDAAALGARADHFAWMRHPRRVVDHLLG